MPSNQVNTGMQQGPQTQANTGMQQAPQTQADQKTQMTLNSLFTNLRKRIEGEYNALLQKMSQFVQQA